jgi:hypothetical protein
MTTSGLPEKYVQLAWQEIAAFAQEIHDRSDNPNGWEIVAGSALARDDKASAPWQVSHLVQSLFVSSTDHLHALRTLLFEAGALHAYTPGTITRSAIETAASAAWVLQPDDPKVRRLRALQLRFIDDRDRRNAMRTWGVTEESEAQRQRWLDEGKSRLGVEKLTAPRTTAVLLEVSKYVNPSTRLSPYAMWQLASGFAHGRQWPVLGLLEREERDSVDPDSVNIRPTMSLERLLPLAMVAKTTLEFAVSLYEKRGAKPVPPAARSRQR